jgi:hypothetical protein
MFNICYEEWPLIIRLDQVEAHNPKKESACTRRTRCDLAFGGDGIKGGTLLVVKRAVMKMKERYDPQTKTRRKQTHSARQLSSIQPTADDVAL